MNVEIGTETPIFLFWEYLFQISGILSLQCEPSTLATAKMAGTYLPLSNHCKYLSLLAQAQPRWLALYSPLSYHCKYLSCQLSAFTHHPETY
jgi:hypothetical protein